MVNLATILTSQQMLAGLVLIWLVLWVGHWLPWPQFIGRKLPRVAAYVYGSVTVLLAFAIWQWGNWPLIAGLGVLYLIAGIATCAAYGLDSIGNWIATRRRRNNASANAHR